MPLDLSLVGYESRPETGTISADDVRAFADAIGDDSAIYRDAAAARAAGYTRIPAPPTFVTRFRVSFTEAGLDVEHMQVLHGEQEYTYLRAITVGEMLTVRHRISSLRQSARGGMAIMALEQLCDTQEGDRVVTGKATIIVRDSPPDVASASTATTPKPRPNTLTGEPIRPLTKHVTQHQIDAYAEVSGDHNPIHINPEVARAVGLDGTIAHGMLSMAFVGQLLTDWLQENAPGGWLARLRVRFQAMVRPGDSVTCHAVLGARQENRQPLDVWIENQRGERVLAGNADLMLG